MKNVIYKAYQKIAKKFKEMPLDIHFREILTGSAVTFLLKMSGMLLSYILMVIISQQYGAEGVGLYNISISVMMLISMMAMLGLNVSILRYVGQFNQTAQMHKVKLLYHNAIEITLPISIALSFLLYLYASEIATYFFKNTLYRQALIFISIILPFYILQDISVEFIRGLKKLNVSEYLRSVNRPLLSIVFLTVLLGIFKSNIMLPLYTLGAGIVFGATYAFLFIKKHLYHVRDTNPEKISKKELITTSLPMMLTTIASFAMGNISLFLLEFYSTTKIAGIFSVAFKLSMLINIVLVVINTISAPKFSELFWANKHKELQVVLDHSARLIFISSSIIALMILGLNKFLLSIFGAEFMQGNIVLIILVIAQMINAMTGSVGVFMNMTGNQKALRNIFLLALLTNIISQILLIPSYGYEGAAFGTMVGAIVVNLLSVIYVRRRLGFRTYYNPILKYQNTNKDSK
ncbi:MAG: flippase [Proteobacteria bacterium]|nr:flippase [Pseudomonadota bacterium]MBU1388035.1 flippase [Pseudomonadota bacterium]MBU1542098.1 flippase [Pseudomonadota bacterium]MBU2429279.1 flippase [Pseudomonadota bacterium]MBU2482882.1 flippase [Pseudomonadota bacterium]